MHIEVLETLVALHEACAPSVILLLPSPEVTLVDQKLASKSKYDAIICLGALIRGETPHFDYIASECTKGIAAIALQAQIPVTYGIITANTVDQAVNRAGVKVGNKGADAALAAIEMVDLYNKIDDNIRQ